MALTKPSPAMAPPTLGTEVSATGTAVTFTGIPSGTRLIVITLSNVSLNGVSNIIVQIGDAGGLENSGYLGSTVFLGSSTGGANQTTGFGVSISTAFVDTSFAHGAIYLSLEDSTAFTWSSSTVMGRSDDAFAFVGAGVKSLSQELTQVSITSTQGNTFDAGSINILYF